MIHIHCPVYNYKIRSVTCVMIKIYLQKNYNINVDFKSKETNTASEVKITSKNLGKTQDKKKLVGEGRRHIGGKG